MNARDAAWFLFEINDGIATLGHAVKCLVLDLDNTLWGGVVADDGIEGIAIGPTGEGEPFHRFQQYLRELKRRGLLLSVCSKNDPETALRPFREHSDMVLREDDFAVFIANWQPKVDNLRAIQQALNIGLDSMVFLDDSPFERDMVRQYLPQVIVPDLPEEPADYVRSIAELNLFEAISFTGEDGERSRYYQLQASRELAQQAFTDVNNYLRSLEMRVVVERFDPVHLPRIAQLVQRSNQFNLTTRRYSLAECEALMNDHNRTLPVYVKLSDRFGDYGLISVVVVRSEGDTAHIDGWLMSCRVISRGVEQHAMNHVVAWAREQGIRRLVGRYIPTAKNAMVREFFAQFGYTRSSGDDTSETTWELDVARYRPHTTHLTPVPAVPTAVAR